MDQKENGLGVVQAKELNGLSYEELPSVSVGVSRTFERQFFQKNTYGPGEEALCDMNTGAKYVNCRRSYLTFKVQCLGTAGVPALPRAGFGTGSVCNMIKRIVVTTRSGVELCRTEDFNVLMAKLMKYGCDKSYLEQFGGLMGYDADSDTSKRHLW